MKHTLIAWMRDRPGVLNRVAGLLRRRNFNIDSLQVGASETPGISRMTFVLDGNERQLDQVVKQLRKIIDVTRVDDVSSQPCLVHELVMMRVNVSPETRADVKTIVEMHGAKVIDPGWDSMVIQFVGVEEDVDRLISQMDHFGISELVRTGRVAMTRSTTQKRVPRTTTVWRAVSNGKHLTESERMKTGGV